VREHAAVDAGGHAAGTVGLRVALRKATWADGPLLVAWRNADRDRFGDTAPLTLDGHLSWWSGVYEQDPWDHLYIIEAGGVPAGTIGIRLGGRPEIQRVLLGDKTLARTGVMSAALDLLTDGYGLPQYWLRVRTGNAPAIRFYECNDFRRQEEDREWTLLTR
jgi:RimJ/RimL family protein N-acetyltransferase